MNPRRRAEGVWLWLLGAVGLFAVVALLAIFVPLAVVPSKGLTVNERLNAENDLRTTLVQFAGGSILLFGTALTLYINREGQITERFTRAIEHLGQTDDKLDIRLGGIYALERIARESSRDRGPIVEVLTAFLRQHARFNSDESHEGRVPVEPGVDVQAAVTVLGRNRWSRRHPYDLREVDLRRAHLSGAHLEEADLRGAHLEEADLSGAHLEEATLWIAHLEGANLDDAHLEGADLVRAHLDQASLIDAHLEEAKLMGAHLEGADLIETYLSAAMLMGAHLEGAQLIDAHLEGASLIEARLEGADLRGAHLEGADLRGAHLEGANLMRTHLERAELNDAHLEGASLMGAYLGGPSSFMLTWKGPTLREPILRAPT